MIHEIVKRLEEATADRGLQLVGGIVLGPEYKATSYIPERVVVERDTAGDRFAPSRSQRRNGKSRGVRHVGGLVRIFARSEKAGSMLWEHERRAERILDTVFVSLDDIAVAMTGSHDGLTVTSGKFTQPPDLAKSDSPGGAVYEMTFTLARSINDVPFEEAPVGDDLTIRSTTNVKMYHGPDDEVAETGCGG